MKFYRNDTEILDIRPEDDSTQHVVHMGENVLNLEIHTTSPLDLRVNDFVFFADEKYKLKTLTNPTRKSRHEFEYQFKMYSPQYDLQDALYILEDSTGVGILDDTVPLFGTASFHLRQIVKCAKAVHPEWTVGDVEEPAEGKNITYTDMDCLQALQHMCEEFGIEYWITGTTISLGKKKHGAPVLFRYGRGNALYELGRTNLDGRIVTKLLVKGSDRNIDSSTYGSRFLHLPDGERYVTRNTEKYGVIMGRISFPDVYPRLIHKQPADPGSVTSVRVENGIYYIKDAYLDFEPELLPGKNIVVDFQTGQLGGVRIDANWHDDTKEFELITGDYGLGQDIPAGVFVPDKDDLYLLSDLKMPQTYIEAAERELAEKGEEAIAQMCEQKVSYKGPVNPLFFRQLDERVETGRAVIVEDDAIVDGSGSVELRVMAFTRGLNDDLNIDIEISDTLYVSRIDRIESTLQEVKVDTNGRISYGDAYMRRRYRDAEETSEMLKAAQLNFSEAVNPIVVQTMQLLVGDRSLQFRFVNSRTNPVAINHVITYNRDTKKLRCPAGILQHMTLGIDTVSPAHVPNEYRFWDMALFESAILTESAKRYYLYAKVPRTGTAGTFLLSENSIAMEGVAGYYHLLAGFLNSEYEGERSFVKMYGFTEILPGQIFTGVISDPDRSLIIDLLARKIIAEHGAEIIGKITFSSGTSGYDNITDRPDLDAWMDDILFDANQYAQQVANQAASYAQSNAVAASILSIQSAREALAQNLGYDGYSDLVTRAQAGKTLVVGEYLRTALIDANAIVTSELVAQRITAAMIAALNITTSKLTVTDGAKIGSYTISGGSFIANTDDDPYIRVETPDGRRAFALGRGAFPMNGFKGGHSAMGHIINKQITGVSGPNDIALALTAMGEVSGEDFSSVGRALVANGSVFVGGSLCVFHDAMLDAAITAAPSSDASVLTYCRKFVYQPGSAGRTISLPGRAAIENVFVSNLARQGQAGRMWTGKYAGYQGWVEVDILCSRYATGSLNVTCPSGTTMVDNDGNVQQYIELKKGDIATFCYYNSSWYLKISK